MKYDVIVIGGGPGGLMAAKTAAENGLKVLLVERKKELTKINRACLQIFYLKWVCPDGYIEPVKIELSPDKTRLHFPVPGCYVDYTGPLKPYCNAIWISPSGYRVYPFKNELFGFFYDKEHLLAGLLASAEKAGAEVITGAMALGVENTAEGVKISVRTKSGEETLEAKKAIAADGVNSRIVDSLGLNQKRQVFNPKAHGVAYVMEGVEPTIPGHETAWLSVKIPGKTAHKIGIGLMPGDAKWVTEGYQYLMKVPEYTPWFRHARVVKKMAFAATVRTPIREPVAGNVMIIGDAATPIETWIQGAIACGYQAVKAILKELNGQKGYLEYIAWWQKAFFFNDPRYFNIRIVTPALNRVCSDEEVDYIYKLFQDKRVVPTLAIAKNQELIKDERPELYQKIKTSLGEMLKELEPLLATYPPDSTIFKEPDSHLEPWHSYPSLY
jgi:flavin-dependent dehydrogenase